MRSNYFSNMLLMVAFAGVCRLPASAEMDIMPLAADAEKTARSAVGGVCLIGSNPGHDGASAKCNIYNPTTNFGPTVPAGKILVIEDLNASCVKGAGDTLRNVFLSALPSVKFIPMQVIGTRNGNHHLLGAQLAKAYALPGSKVYGQISFDGLTSSYAGCTIRFHGYFVKAQ